MPPVAAVMNCHTVPRLPSLGTTVAVTVSPARNVVKGAKTMELPFIVVVPILWPPTWALNTRKDAVEASGPEYVAATDVVRETAFALRAGLRLLSVWA